MLTPADGLPGLPAHAGTNREAQRRRRRYRRALLLMKRTGIPFLIGGGYALRHYAGGVRGTKDLDVFVRRRDAVRLRYPVAVALHGHAHHGRFEGRTRSDVPVYNVCIPVLERLNLGHPPFWTVDLNPAASPSAVVRRLRVV